MDDLATLCGRPRPLRAAGRSWRLWPLRLLDLGDLQAWLYDQLPDPLPAVLAATAGLGRGARSFALRHAVARRRESRATFGTPAADQLCSSVDGLTEVLWLSVRRGRPRFGRHGAARLYDALGHDAAREWARWAIWGDRPAAVTAAWDGDAEGTEDADEWDWWKLMHTLSLLPNWAEAGAGRGWTPPQVAELTIPQLRVAFAENPPGSGESAEGYAAIAFIRRIEARRAREVEEWEMKA